MILMNANSKIKCCWNVKSTAPLSHCPYTSF